MVIERTRWGIAPPAGTEAARLARAAFVSGIYALAGEGKVDLLFLPSLGDTTTSTTSDHNAATVTWDATVASRLSPQGSGVVQTFNGTDQVGTSPDANRYSYGDGSYDSPFSILFWGTPADAADNIAIVSKYDILTSNRREWYLRVDDTTAVLRFTVRDESASVSPSITSDAAITLGSPIMLGATYKGTRFSGSRGEVAMNEVTLYVNGASVAATAANNASYVAMENLAGRLAIGGTLVGSSGALSEPFSSSVLCVALLSRVLSAGEVFAAKEMGNTYWGLSL